MGLLLLFGCDTILSPAINKIIGTSSSFVSPMISKTIDVGTSLGISAAEELGVAGNINDTILSLEIKHLWFQHDHTLPSTLGLTVYDNRVLITGALEDLDLMTAAVRIAWQPENTKEVINEIDVIPDWSVVKKAYDKLIEAQIKTKLLLDKDISSINYRMVVFNRTLYLLGIAKDKTELDNVIHHARNLEYVRKVISHVKLKELEKADSN
ncbi:MAG: BON domain-containing protein [Alphaproteobacteria bacterium]|nr:BON domain-containing protein [Alphaproteobacteria bacterium]